MHYMHFLVCILPGTASFQECSKEKTEPNALWRAHIQSKGVKELPTDSPYKPCFNKPLPPPISPSPPLTHQTGGKSAFMAQFLFWTAAHKPPSTPSLPSFCPCLPLPLLSSQQRRQSGVSWLQSPLCITYTRWYNFCSVVKQLQGRSCSLAGANYTVRLVLKAPLLSKVVF